MMKFASAILYCLILKALLQYGHTKKKSKICLFETLQYNFNKNYVARYDIKILPDRITLDFDADIIQPLSDDIWCEISVKKCNHKYQQCYDLLGYNVNICAILGKDTDKYNILHYWLQIALKYGDIPKKCPIDEGTYAWHNLRPFKGNLPTFLLRGHYLTNVLFYAYKPNMNITVANTTVGARLR